MCFTHVSFFHEFWVALSALWDRLTCNPSTYMQSKHTFQILHFFFKKAPWRPSNESLFERFLTTYVIFVWENGFQKLLQKRCPSRFKHNSINRPGGSRRGSLTCALYKQETVVWAAVEALFEIFAEKSGLGWKLVWQKWLDSWIVAKKTEWTVDFWKLRQV